MSPPTARTMSREVRLARRLLGNRTGFRVPEGGFFLWLDVGNGEETALKLWREAGVRTLARRLYGPRNRTRKTPHKSWVFVPPGGARKRFVNHFDGP